MVRSDQIESTIIKLKPILKQQFAVEKIGYFGSFARDEQTENSDLDILVSFDKPIGWAFFDLQELLENELKIKVDLVSVNALKEQLKNSILEQAKFI